MRSHEVVVVVRRGTHFLVLERSRSRGGYWNLVAGGVEDGEDATAAAGRELEEETGLRAHVHPLGLDLAYEGASGSMRLDAFVADAEADWEPVLDEEHVGYRWCLLDDAVALLAYEEPRIAVRAAVAA
jgi:8-oxo-dGTP pyrophosphatase MutT (NUDIX family)